MQFGPDAGTGAKNEETNGLAAVTERHHEEPRAPVLASLGVADGRSAAVIYLRFFPWSRDDHNSRLRNLGTPELADKAPHALIATGEAGLGDQVLPDGLGVASSGQPEFDQLPVRFAGTDPGTRLGTGERTGAAGFRPLGVEEMLCGVAGSNRSESVITSLAGFGPPESVITSLAGFEGRRWPQAPDGRIGILAVLR